MSLLTAARYEIGDSDPDYGIMPGHKQVSIEQFEYAAEREGVTEFNAPTEQEIGRVSAKLLEMAAAAWASIPVESELGPASEVSETEKKLKQRAAQMRLRYGYYTPTQQQRRVPAYTSSASYYVPPGVD